MTCVGALGIALALTGCGRPGMDITADDGRDSTAQSASRAECPISLPKAGLCARLSWDKGPSADLPEGSAFTVRFWKAGAPETLLDPTQALSSYARMVCCGSIAAARVDRVALGIFSVTGLKLVPGKWDVVLQLKGAGLVEKALVRVEL